MYFLFFLHSADLLYNFVGNGDLQFGDKFYWSVIWTLLAAERKDKTSSLLQIDNGWLWMSILVMDDGESLETNVTVLDRFYGDRSTAGRGCLIRRVDDESPQIVSQWLLSL